MFTILLQVAIVCAISYALWQQLRQSSFKLALNNLPGPPSQSFFFGDVLLILSFKPPSYRLLISRCLSTISQPKWMGISQRNGAEMYESALYDHGQDVNALQMVVL